MIGLMWNGFYSSVGNLKLFLIIVLAAAGITLATGNATAQELFVYIAITAFSINAVVSARKDAVARWDKYEITLPVCRREIIACKYLSYALWVIVGITVAAVVTTLTTLLHGLTGGCSMFALGTGISLLTGAFFYPLSYIAGVDKSETILIVSILLSIGIAIVILQILNQFLASFAIRTVLFIAFYLMVFAISYGITQGIYQKKEF